MNRMIPDDISARDKVVKAYMTQPEVDYLKQAAGGMSLSTYARNTLLGAGTGGYRFEIQDGDISQVGEILHECYDRITGYINALQYRSKFSQTDLNYIRELLTETRNDVKSCMHEIRNDRKAIRRSGEKHLKEHMDKLITPEGMQTDASKTGRRGRRRNRAKGNSVVIVGSLSGNMQNAMSIIKDAVEWGEPIEVVSSDQLTQRWIDSMRDCGRFQTLAEYRKRTQ